MIDGPVPAAVPPQLPLYHTHCAPVPNEPPTTVNSVEEPLHNEPPVVLVIEAGSVDGTFTVTLNEQIEVFPEASIAV